MKKVNTNHVVPEESRHPAITAKQEYEKLRTCENCDESIFCELAIFNDRRCESSASEK